MIHVRGTRGLPNRLEVQNQEPCCFRMPRRTSQNLGKGERVASIFQVSHRGAPLILPLPSASDTPLPLPLANRAGHGLAVPAFNVGPCMDVAAGPRRARQGMPGDAWPLAGISSSNVPHLPHQRNPLSFYRRRNLGDLRASQPGTARPARHGTTKPPHSLLPEIL